MKKAQISFTTTKENQVGLTKIASKMGMSLSAFLTACATQIRLHNGLPYPMKLPMTPPLTSDSELNKDINKFKHGYRGEKHHLIE